MINNQQSDVTLFEEPQCNGCDTCLLGGKGILVALEGQPMQRLKHCTQFVRRFVKQVCHSLNLVSLPPDAVVTIAHGNADLTAIVSHPDLIPSNLLRDASPIKGRATVSSPHAEVRVDFDYVANPANDAFPGVLV